MRKSLRISTLGGLDIQYGGEPITGLASRKAEALLVYLAITGRPHPRESLATMLWDDKSQSRSLSNLSVLLTSLRKQLNPYIITTRQTAAFNQEGDYWLDITELETHISLWRERIGLNSALSVTAIKDIEGALGMYEGDFLAGFYIRDSHDFEEWALLKRERLQYQVIETLEELATYLLNIGEYKKGIETAKHLLELDTLHEGAHQLLMRLLTLRGQRSEALNQYETCRLELQKELGVQPSEETQILYEQVSKGEKLLYIPHRQPLHNLPMKSTSLIGRDEELKQIAKQLADRECRLLTLVGAGGIGKTRLGLQAAVDALDDYPDGVWLVELAASTEAEFLPEKIASVFGVSAQEAREGRGETDVLVEYLREKNLLLVLDNCEHLIDACADFADALLKRCPKVKLLASSREDFGIQGERTFRVSPLALPPDEAPLQDLEKYSAIRLFLDRAAAARPRFGFTEENSAVLTEICRQLDGIPLALELAAARVKVLSLEQIAERLQDRFQLLTGGPRTALPRHQTLLSTMDWSYGLLIKPERALLRRLSVFSGGWTLEAAEEIASFNNKANQPVLDVLTQLVDKSLVGIEKRGRVMRYGMLETVRQYGMNKLSEEGEVEEVYRHHASFFAQLAEHADEGLRDARQLECLKVLETEHENLRIALGWCIDNIEANLAFRLVGALGWFWFMGGHWKDAKRWLNKSLDLSTDSNPLLRAKAIYRVGGLELIRGNLVGTIELVEEALGICREEGDEEGTAWCLNLLGQGRKWNQEDIAKAEPLFYESVEIFNSLKNDWGVSWSQRYLGQVTELQGDYERGISLQKEGLHGFEDVGDVWNAAHSLYLMGVAGFRHSDFQEAKWAYEESLKKCKLVDDKVMVAHSLRGLAQLALQRDDIKEAEILFQEALEALNRIGDESCAAYALRDLGELSRRKGDFEEANKFLRESMHSYQKLGIADAMIWTVVRFASLAESMGNRERAARILGAIEIPLKESTLQFTPTIKNEHEKLIASIQNLLGNQTFERLLAEGAAMNLEEVVAYALEETRKK